MSSRRLWQKAPAEAIDGVSKECGILSITARTYDTLLPCFTHEFELRRRNLQLRRVRGRRGGLRAATQGATPFTRAATHGSPAPAAGAPTGASVARGHREAVVGPTVRPAGRSIRCCPRATEKAIANRKESTVTAVDSVIAGEHISPALVRKLGEKGLYAEAVAHVGLSGEPDEHIWNYALKHDFYGRHNQRARLHPSSERGSAPGPHRPPRERPDPRRTMGPHSTHNRPHFGIE